MIRRGVLLLDGNSCRVLGGSIQTTPENNPLSTSNIIPPVFPPTNPPPLPPSIQKNPPSFHIQDQATTPPFSLQAPVPDPPRSTPASQHPQESKFEIRKVLNLPNPYLAVQRSSVPCIDLITSPNEVKTSTNLTKQKRISPQPKTMIQVDDEQTIPFAYDLCDIDETYQIDPQRNQTPFESRLQVQDVFQPGRRVSPATTTLHQSQNSSHSDSEKSQNQNPPQMNIVDFDVNQLSGGSQGTTSQTSSITPFVISPDNSAMKYHRKASPIQSSFHDLSGSPHERSPLPRFYISDLLFRPSPPPIQSYYIEGEAIGVEAIKVDHDPLTHQLRFFIIILFEEKEQKTSLTSYPILVDTHLCQEILKLSPMEYQQMLEKLTNKSERKEFKVMTCTQLTELTGKFRFQVNPSHRQDAYVGILLSFIS
jgi:hypothetical protein